MIIHSFEINIEAIKRKFSVYTVVAYKKNHFYLYVGKTGDNREGCNPIISRCGNHFSYNRIHSQIRNKINNHELYNYKYFFINFDDYKEGGDNRKSIDKINEMERWLNQKIQEYIIKDGRNIELLNPYIGKNRNSKTTKDADRFRNPQSGQYLDKLVIEVKKFIDSL